MKDLFTAKMGEIEFKGKPVNIVYASSLLEGYGHQRINIEVEYEGLTENFSATTNFMPGYDAAMELEGQEKYEALYSLIANDIDEDILEWLVTNF